MAALPKLVTPAPSDLAEYFAVHGQFPRLSDERKPWTYKGWLLMYVIEIHRLHPEVPDRWGYWFRTREAGRLLAEPIPKIAFGGTADHKVQSDIQSWLDILDGHYGGWSSFGRLLEWLAFGLAVDDTDPKLNPEISEKLYRALNVGPMLLAPYDHLGSFLETNRGKGKFWNSNAFYATPHNVVEFMVQMQLADSKPEDLLTAKVCDPCLGTGRMLLHASNYCLRLFGADIDRTVLMIARINGALYAPWMSFPLPEEYFVPADREKRIIQLLHDRDQVDHELRRVHQGLEL